MFKEHIESVLKANKVDYSAMSDEQKIAKYDEIKGNAAEETTKPGEQSKPGEVVVNEAVQKLIDASIARALKANQENTEAGERKALAEKLKANGVELSEAAQKAMSINELQIMVNKTAAPKNVFSLAGGQMQANAATGTDDDLPE